MPESKFELSITRLNDVTREPIGPPVTRTLHCHPDGGTELDPASACAQLNAAHGYIEDIPAHPGLCPEIVELVVFRAHGEWEGEERHYEREFTNQCFGNNATGGVIFNF
jgi:hypothetical protein